MILKKKCSVCGYEFTFDNEIRTNLHISPKMVGAKGYFDLWHYHIERCPKCGYASKDVSECKNTEFVTSGKYKCEYQELLDELAEARPHKIGDYLVAGAYYDSIDDEVNFAKCLFQAADLVYAEIMYWKEYIFDFEDGNPREDMQYVRFEACAEDLYARGLKVLKAYINSNPRDLDAQILYAGICSDGSSMQKMQGVNMLKKLMLNPAMSSLQKEMVAYLLQDL